MGPYLVTGNKIFCLMYNELDFIETVRSSAGPGWPTGLAGKNRSFLGNVNNNRPSEARAPFSEGLTAQL